MEIWIKKINFILEKNQYHIISVYIWISFHCISSTQQCINFVYISFLDSSFSRCQSNYFVYCALDGHLRTNGYNKHAFTHDWLHSYGLWRFSLAFSLRCLVHKMCVACGKQAVIALITAASSSVPKTILWCWTSNNFICKWDMKRWQVSNFSIPMHKNWTKHDWRLWCIPFNNVFLFLKQTTIM